MANYNGYARSNEFRIKEGMEEHIKFIFENMVSDGEIYTDLIHENGHTYGWFGSYGCIYGLEVERYDSNGDLIDTDVDDAYEYLTNELQKCVHEESYIQLVDVGYEKLRYVGGGCLVITSNDIQYIDICDAGNKLAKEMLKTKN